MVTLLALGRGGRRLTAFATVTADAKVPVASIGSSWTTTLVDHASRGWPALAVDCSGTARIAYQQEGGAGFGYQTVDASNFGQYTAPATDPYVLRPKWADSLRI